MKKVIGVILALIGASALLATCVVGLSFCSFKLKELAMVDYAHTMVCRYEDSGGVVYEYNFECEKLYSGTYDGNPVVQYYMDSVQVAEVRNGIFRADSDGDYTFDVVLSGDFVVEPTCCSSVDGGA